jgi:hypothetical protein
MTTTPPRSDPESSRELPPAVRRFGASIALWLGLLAAIFAPLLLVGFLVGGLVAYASLRAGRRLFPTATGSPRFRPPTRFDRSEDL